MADANRKRRTAVALTVSCHAWTEAIPEAGKLSRAAARLALRGAPTGAEVSLVLADDATVHELNRTWRGQDKPTNVLSFPGDDTVRTPGAPVLLGDVVVAYETARREVEEDGQARTLSDHLAHLVVHGVLHLLGHDHETDMEADEMERIEARLLAELGVPDPYAERDERRST